MALDELVKAIGNHEETQVDIEKSIEAHLKKKFKGKYLVLIIADKNEILQTNPPPVFMTFCLSNLELDKDSCSYVRYIMSQFMAASHEAATRAVGLLPIKQIYAPVGENVPEEKKKKNDFIGGGYV